MTTRINVLLPFFSCLFIIFVPLLLFKLPGDTGRAAPWYSSSSSSSPSHLPEHEEEAREAGQG